MRDVDNGRTRARALVVAAALCPLGAPAPALADETIRAGIPNQFTTPTPSMDQGEPLFFQNLDTNRHDVTATARDPANPSKPLFASATIGANQTVPVGGAQYLTAGSYDFICSIHPFMEGTLTVTSAGTPVPRPGGGGGGGGATDATAPTVRVRITSTKLRTVAGSGKLRVRVSSDESSAVNVTARTRLRGRNVTIARGTATLSGGTRTVSLKLTSSARRALRRARRASISVTARATDAAGNAARATASRRLSR